MSSFEWFVTERGPCSCHPRTAAFMQNVVALPTVTARRAAVLGMAQACLGALNCMVASGGASRPSSDVRRQYEVEYHLLLDKLRLLGALLHEGSDALFDIRLTGDGEDVDDDLHD